MRSFIGTLFICPSKVESELSAVCKEYADICEKLQQSDNKYDMISFEKRRLKLINRIHILNFRLGGNPSD